MPSVWEVVEDAAAAHVRALGFADAQRTGAGNDRGLDVVGRGVAAQVKALNKPVGAPDVQRLFGAADGFRNVLFYSISGYTRAALTSAAQLSIALFDVEGASFVQVNASDVSIRVPRAESEEERAEQALTERCLELRFAAMTWRSVIGGHEYVSAYTSPSTEDLPLTGRVLPRLHHEMLTLRGEFQDLGKAALNVQHRLQSRADRRRWDETLRKFPNVELPVIDDISLLDAETSLDGVRANLEQAIRKILDAAVHPADLRLHVTREARALTMRTQDHFGHLEPALALMGQ